MIAECSLDPSSVPAMPSLFELGLAVVFQKCVFTTKELKEFCLISPVLKTVIREVIFRHLRIVLPSDNLDDVVRVLRSQPGLHLLVESISISGLPRGLPRSNRQIRTHLGVEDLMTLPHAFPSLNSITLTYIVLSTLLDLVPSLPTFHSLRSLALAHVIIDVDTTPFVLLQCLGHRSRFHLEDVRWNQGITYAHLQPHAIVNVGELHITCDNILPLELHPMPSFPNLTSLTCSHVDERAIPWLQQCIQDCRYSLTRLTLCLTLQCPALPVIRWQELDIFDLPCVQLIHYAIPLDFFRAPDDRFHREQLLFTMISHLPDTTKTLALTLDCRSWMTLPEISTAIRALDWEQAAAAFTAENVEQLVLLVKTSHSLVYRWTFEDILKVKRAWNCVIMTRELYLRDSDDAKIF